jgi:hypothetical protein
MAKKIVEAVVPDHAFRPVGVKRLLWIKTNFTPLRLNREGLDYEQR